MSKAALIAFSAVAAGALAMFIRNRQLSSRAAPTGPPISHPTPSNKDNLSTRTVQPASSSSSIAHAVATAPADAANATTSSDERLVDHLASFRLLLERRQNILHQQQRTPHSLSLAQSSVEWSHDADTCAADWRVGKAAGHPSAARALADLHASDEMCSTWAGGAEGWRVQTDLDCVGGRVRDDSLAAQSYVLAEALGDADCDGHLQRLQQCEAAEKLLAFAAELRAQAPLTHHEAQHYLGTVFLHGTMGFAQDFDAAFALFGRAAAANFAPAQSSLGLMLVRGIGRQRDNQKGCVLLATAAAAGDPDAHFFLGYVCFCNRDHAKALNFFTTAHAGTPDGHASAALHLGIMYLNGYGIEADVDKAEMLFKFAMEKGEPDADNAMELLAQKRLQLESSMDSSLSAAEGTEV